MNVRMCVTRSMVSMATYLVSMALCMVSMAPCMVNLNIFEVRTHGHTENGWLFSEWLIIWMSFHVVPLMGQW